MTHLELENLLSDYLEGQLDIVRRVEAEKHLAACAECQALLAEVRQVYELCHSAADLEPAPWLVPRILHATIGERQPSLGQRLAAFFRPGLYIRVAYGVAMAMVSLSIVVNAAGINLRHLTLADLNPRTWVYQADRNGHLLIGRVEKYYYDLKVVYEIESRLRQLRSQPGEPAPRPQAPSGGTTEGAPLEYSPLASVSDPAVPNGIGLSFPEEASGWDYSARSTTR
jgi:hypothetical protein